MSGLELLNDQGLRIDGRRPKELRRIECKMGVLRQADGSAYLEQGNTKVLASVYGPHEARGKNKSHHDRVLVTCEYSMSAFATGERKHRPRGDKKSQEMSMQFCRVFEAAILTTIHPRSQIDIYLQVFQSDGGNYSACINAGTLALIDAGIPMRDYVCACSVGFSNETPLIDINSLEETLGKVELNVAILPRTETVVLGEMTSRLHIDHFVKVLDVAVKCCKDIFAIFENVVRKNANIKHHIFEKRLKR